MAQKKKSWFGAKGLFRHMDPDSPSIQDRYEESIVVLKAESEEQAEQRALEKFRKYAREELGIFFTGHYEICHLFDPVRAGREVYWFMRRQGVDAFLAQSGWQKERLSQLPGGPPRKALEAPKSQGSEGRREDPKVSMRSDWIRIPTGLKC
jgi:hypothetical protein